MAPNNISRRRALTAIGGAVITATAGCTGNIPGLGGNEDSRRVLPPLVEGWAQLQNGGGTKVLLRFDGDVTSFPDVNGTIKENLAKQLAPDGVTLSPETVDIPGSGHVQDSHSIQGVVHRDGTADTSQIAGATHHEITGFQVTRQKATLHIDELGQDVSVEVPIQSPTYHLYSPNGYHYNLPADHQMVRDEAGNYGIKVRRNDTNKGLFSYEGLPKNVTIPAITHTDYPGLAPIRQSAEYRSKLITQFRPMVDEDQYNERAVDAITAASQNLQAEFLSSSIESLLTYNIPTAVSLPYDLTDTHNSLKSTHQDFERAFERLKEQMDFAIGNTIIGQIETDGGGQGLQYLNQQSKKNYFFHNPLLASAPSSNLFDSWSSKYRQSLNNQKTELERMYGVLSGASPPNQLTKTLIDFSFNVVKALHLIISSELQTLPDR